MTRLRRTIVWVLLFTCLYQASLTFGKISIIYVDSAAMGASDGSSWADAHRHLQDALDDANDSDKPVEIRVAQGVYRPDRDSAHPGGTRDRSASFGLLDGVVIRGGFGGFAVPNPDALDIARYETILSGDLAGDDAVVLDSCDLLSEPTRAENSYAIVTAGACSRSAVLDGFTIRAANALNTGLESEARAGAGLLLSYYGADCCPSVKNCTFVDNRAGRGAAVVVVGTHPELVRCTFMANAALDGGAMYTTMWRNHLEETTSACDLVVRDCLFAGNYARRGGGALYVGNGAPFTVEGCTFRKNRAWEGGAVYNWNSVSLVNCLLIHNVASYQGGAIYSGGRLEISSCTVAGNTAPTGRALTCFGAATITNSILWDDGDKYDAEIQYATYTELNITYSDILGGSRRDVSNVNTDPLFADPGHWDPNGTPNDPNDDVWIDGDYHLKSQGGRWNPGIRSWVVDDVTSPCIDAGDPNSPLGAEPAPSGGRIDMGVYGGTAEASKSP